MQVGAGTSILQTGVQGIQAGQNNVRQAATNVASNTVTERPVDRPSQLDKSLVDLQEGERQVQASAKVVEAGDKTLGSIIDIKA